MRKTKRNYKRGNKLDTVGVVGSTPIAPTIQSSKNTLKTADFSAFWLADLYASVLEEIAKTIRKQRKHCGKIAVIRA